MAILNVEDQNPNPTFVAASSGGDEFVNDGRSQIFVLNQSGASIRMRRVPQQKCDQNFDHGDAEHVGPDVNNPGDMEDVCPTGAISTFGPYDTHTFNNAFDRMELEWPDGVTSVQVVIMRMLPGL